MHLNMNSTLANQREASDVRTKEWLEQQVDTPASAVASGMRRQIRRIVFVLSHFVFTRIIELLRQYLFLSNIQPPITIDHALCMPETATY